LLGESRNSIVGLDVGLSFRLVVSRPGFDFLAESDQKTLKISIHSFPA